MIVQAKLAIAAGVVVASFSAGWEWRDRSADLAAAETQLVQSDAAVTASEQIRTEEAAQAKSTNEIGKASVDDLAAAREVANTINKEILNHAIKISPVAACDFSSEWVRIHDKAASAGNVPDDYPRPGPPDETARKATSVEALRVVTGNYATCNETRLQLLGLQDWAALIMEPPQAIKNPR